MISAIFLCLVASVTDGDTFRCSDHRAVRLAGIDAPEIHRCPRTRQCTPGDGQASKRALTELIQGKNLTCQSLGYSYARILATCRMGNTDPSCSQVRNGYAVLRYSEKWRVCR